MGYTLGSITLPNPVSLSREHVETSVANITINGTTFKDITNRKERYILSFVNLTQAEIGNIMSEYNMQTHRNFVVSETNLTINSTQVHIDIASREYNSKGIEYREDITLVLTEVH